MTDAAQPQTQSDGNVSAPAAAPPAPTPPPNTKLARTTSAEAIASSEGAISPFASSSTAAWDLANRMSVALAKSSIVPKDFVDSPANCMIAMEYAARLQVSVLAVMQNLAIIHGKPGLSSSFLIGSVNASGRFTPLRFEFAGTVGKDDYACRAVAKDRASGEVLEGEWITWVMAQREGWVERKGSKWKTMPGQMMRYRAASFWVRVYCPDIALGFRTNDELEDMHGPSADDGDVGAMPRELAPAGARSLEDVLGLQRTAPQAIDTQGETVPTAQPSAPQQAQADSTPPAAKPAYNPETGELSPEQEAELERQERATAAEVERARAALVGEAKAQQGSLLPDGKGAGKAKR